MNDAAAKLPQLVEQMEIAEKKATMTLEISKALEERLRDHLRQPQPTCKPAEPKPAQELVPAAAKLRNIHNTMSTAFETLNDIMQRLEA
jgi:hypothetical protein